MSLGLLAIASSAGAETRKFNMYTVELGGVKMWLPSTIVVNKGDEVEITATTKIQTKDPAARIHGFTIDEFKIVEAPDDKGKTIKFKADKEGIFNIRCHLHPAHVGGQLVVLD